MSSKLERDLGVLVEATVISPETSKKISDYYLLKKTNNSNRLFTIFGVLGAMLVGLGIILIIAHNWDDFSRPIKTTWAFAPLLVGQAFVGYSLFKKKSTAWKEASTTFLFFAIGACISLVSQIYNIPGSLDSFLLLWIVLASPLLYLMRSHAAALLHLVFSTYYACEVGYFNTETPWMYLALILWLIPYYLKLVKQPKERPFSWAFNWLIALSLVISLGAFLIEGEGLGFLMYLLLFGILYSVGEFPVFSSQKRQANGYSVIGSIGIIFCLILVSFKWFWQDMNHDAYTQQDLSIVWALLLTGVGLLMYLHAKKRVMKFNLFRYAPLIFALLFLTHSQGFELPMILTNVLVLALGVYAIRNGAKSGYFGTLNYGLAIITTLIACRFFDVNITFVVRGLIFLALGAGFFLANYLMYKKQQKSILTKNLEL